jgi:hypothetical protein
MRCHPDQDGVVEAERRLGARNEIQEARRDVLEVLHVTPAPITAQQVRGHPAALHLGKDLQRELRRGPLALLAGHLHLSSPGQVTRALLMMNVR